MNQTSTVNTIVRDGSKTILCKACGWLFKPERLSTDEFEALYSAVGGHKTVAHVGFDVVLKRAERISKRISSYSRVIGHRIIDVGGGVGQASLEFARKGHEVHVVDVSATSALHSTMRVHRKRLEDFSVQGLFDLAVMAHVLEHVWSPTHALRTVYELLAPMGIVYIEVPFELFTPLILRKTGDIAHVGYFSRATLEAFLLAVGFTEIRVNFCSDTYGTRRLVTLTAYARKSRMNSSVPSTPMRPTGTGHLWRDLLSLRQLTMTAFSRL